MTERTRVNCLELFLGAAASSNSPLGSWVRESTEHGVLCKVHSLLPHSFLCLLFLFPKQGTRKRKRNWKVIGLGYKSASGKKEGHLGTHSSSCVHSNSRGKEKLPILKIVHAPIFHKAEHDHLLSRHNYLTLAVTNIRQFRQNRKA